VRSVVLGRKLFRLRWKSTNLVSGGKAPQVGGTSVPLSACRNDADECNLGRDLHRTAQTVKAMVVTTYNIHQAMVNVTLQN